MPLAKVPSAYVMEKAVLLEWNVSESAGSNVPYVEQLIDVPLPELEALFWSSPMEATSTASSVVPLTAATESAADAFERSKMSFTALALLLKGPPVPDSQ